MSKVSESLSPKPTMATFQVDGYAVHWPGNFSWNGNTGPEVYPVQIDRIVDCKVDARNPEGKTAWVWFRRSDRPSLQVEQNEVSVLFFGKNPKIDGTNMRPCKIHPTREDAISRIRQMAADRIADIEGQLRKYTHV